MTLKKMEIWEYIEVLNQPNNTWLLKNNVKKKINALTIIRSEGSPSLISDLTKFLNNENKEIRETTCRTIIHLFKKIGSKKSYYNSLKHCGISINDINFFETNFPKEQYVELLAICSLNGNGYVREVAVKKLSQVENPKAIQFIIYRLADWVEPVKQAALIAIQNFKSLEYIDSLIENLLLFNWLQKVERSDLSGIYQDIIEFIASTNRTYVIDNFKKYPDKLRLILAKHISITLSDHSTELKLFLSDKHFLIRNLAIEHFSKLEQSDINQLLNDKSANVRLQVLYCLKDKTGFETTVKKFLADNSATIRHFARFNLNEANFNLADFYNDNLMERNQVIGSLSGLAEIGGKQYAESVKNYLNDKKIRVKKTAFSALCKLDEESAYEFGLINLDSSYVGIRNLIIDYLSKNQCEEVLKKAQEIYKSDNYEMKISMLNLFNKIGGWGTIPDLMLGTIDKNENIRQIALGYLQIWKSKAVRLFSTPKLSEMERAKQIFNFVNETHQEKKYFTFNPLEGLELYFK